MLCRFTAFVLAALCPALVQAEEQISLWPGGAPGVEDRRERPEIKESSYICEIHKPSISAFFSPSDNAAGAALVACPGGALRFLAIAAEGIAPACLLSNLGVAAFVCEYRRGGDDTSPYLVYDIVTDARED